MKFSQLAILTAGLFFILAAIWMFCPQLLLTQWGITPTPGTDVLGHRSAALYAGLGVMCLFARHAALAGTLCPGSRDRYVMFDFSRVRRC
ncbi:hypothetical protein O8E90_003942 [Enterobacter ludwigii]